MGGGKAEPMITKTWSWTLAPRFCLPGPHPSSERLCCRGDRTLRSFIDLLPRGRRDDARVAGIT